MAIISWSLWILIWGLAGYFNVRAIILYVKKKRMEKDMAAYWQHQSLMMRNAGKVEGSKFSYNPFADLLKEEEL